MSKLCLPIRVSPRHFAAAVVLVFLVQPLGSPGFGIQEASAAGMQSATFGMAGDPLWTHHQPAFSEGLVGEAMLGVSWKTPPESDVALMQAGGRTLRAIFDDTADPVAVTWTDVTWTEEINQSTSATTDQNPAYAAWSASLYNPLLEVDRASGRALAGQQAVRNPCTFLFQSQDNGEKWDPVVPPCAIPAIDKPTVGMGPLKSAADGPSSSAAYLCGWEPGLSTHCYSSNTGGQTWTPMGPVLGAGPVGGACAGHSGRIHVGTTGDVFLPYASCGGKAAFLVSKDEGTMWDQVPIADSNGDGAFPPAVATTKGGYVYVVASEADGAYVARFDPEYSQLDVAGEQWLKISDLYEGPNGETIKQAEFAAAVAGDDDRAAVAFLGTFDAQPKNTCDSSLAWFLFGATTYDAGETWAVQRLADHPVQAGGIGRDDPLDPASAECRNLVDGAIDMDISAEGRMHVAYVDGCIDTCSATNRAPGASGFGASWQAIARQSTGRSLFSEFDVSGGPDEPFLETCGRTMDPAVTIFSPTEGEVVTDPLLDVDGIVDRRPRLLPVVAVPGALEMDGYANEPIPLTGVAECGYGALPSGFMDPDTYTCTWTPRGGDPVFEPNNEVCGNRGPQDPAAVYPSVTYFANGTYHLDFEVQDRAGQVDNVTIKVEIGTPRLPEPPLTGCEASRPGRVIGMEDLDDHNPVVPTEGTNELTCFGVYYQLESEQMEFQIGVMDNTTYPNDEDDRRTAQRFWIHFTPNFGDKRGQEQIIEVVQGHEDPSGDGCNEPPCPDWEPADPWVFGCLLIAPQAREVAGYRPLHPHGRTAGTGGVHCGGQVLGAEVDKVTGRVTYVTLPMDLLGPVVPGARLDDVWLEAWHVPGANTEDWCLPPDDPDDPDDRPLGVGPACAVVRSSVDASPGPPPSVPPPEVEVDTSSMMPTIDDIANDCKTSEGEQVPRPVGLIILPYDISIQYQPCFAYSDPYQDPAPLGPETEEAGSCEPGAPGYARGRAHVVQSWSIVEACVDNEQKTTFDMVVRFQDASTRPPAPLLQPVNSICWYTDVCIITGLFGTGVAISYAVSGCLDHPSDQDVAYRMVYEESLEPTSQEGSPLVPQGLRGTYGSSVLVRNPSGGTDCTRATDAKEGRGCGMPARDARGNRNDPIATAFFFGNELRFRIDKHLLDVRSRPTVWPGCNVSYYNDGSTAHGAVDRPQRALWECMNAQVIVWPSAEVVRAGWSMVETEPCFGRIIPYPFGQYNDCSIATLPNKTGFVGKPIQLSATLVGCDPYDRTSCDWDTSGPGTITPGNTCPPDPANPTVGGLPEVTFDECGKFPFTLSIAHPGPPISVTDSREAFVTVGGDDCTPPPPGEYVTLYLDGEEIEDGQGDPLQIPVHTADHPLRDDWAHLLPLYGVENGPHTLRAEWYIVEDDVLLFVAADEVEFDLQVPPPTQSGPMAIEDPVEDGRDATRLDSDRDGIVDPSDNCPRTPNTGQDDLDTDGTGDACDSDIDGDGWLNHVDNCPRDVDPDRIDSDSDGKGDLCDDDDDNDGIKDGPDNCPLVANKAQVDSDEDGVGDACDGDRDGDGTLDHFDAFPDDPLQWADRDGDGFGDNPGKNGDNCPTIRNPDQTDSDSNGVGDACEGLVEAAASGQSWSIPGELEPLDAAGVDAPESKSPFQGLSIAIVLAVIGLALIGLLAVRTLRRE